MKNCLIVFEGIDGTGKSTITRKLKKELQKRGIASVCFEDIENKEEGFNLSKSFIRKVASIDSSLFFYIASAIHKSDLIKELLKKQWVICDRYVFSTLSYHKALGADINLLPQLEKLPIMMPDFHFLLQVDEKTRMQRVRSKTDSELEDFQPKIPGSFFDNMEKCLIGFDPVIVDSSLMNADETVNHILEIISEQA